MTPQALGAGWKPERPEHAGACLGWREADDVPQGCSDDKRAKVLRRDEVW